MSAITDHIVINTTHDAVRAALTTQAGYLGWWSKDCQIADRVGGESSLAFDKQGVVVKMRFRTDVIEKERIAWTCIGHDMESWVRTRLHWSIAKDGAAVRVTLVHDGWRSATPPEMVAEGWKYFLGSMKRYVETGTGGPW